MRLVDMIGESAFCSGVLSSRVVVGDCCLKMLTMSSLSNRFVVGSDCDDVSVDLDRCSKYLSRSDDLVLKNVGDYVISYVMEDNIVLPSFVHILRIEDEFVRRFVFMRLCSDDFLRYIVKLNGEDVVKRISLEDLKSFELGDFTHEMHLRSNLFFAHEQLSMFCYDLSCLYEVRKRYFINFGGYDE